MVTDINSYLIEIQRFLLNFNWDDGARAIRKWVEQNEDNINLIKQM